MALDVVHFGLLDGSPAVVQGEEALRLELPRILRICGRAEGAKLNPELRPARLGREVGRSGRGSGRCRDQGNPRACWGCCSTKPSIIIIIIFLFFNSPSPSCDGAALSSVSFQNQRPELSRSLAPSPSHRRR